MLTQIKVPKTYKFTGNVKKPCDGQLRTVVKNLLKENQDQMVLLKIQEEDQTMFLLALKQWFSNYVQDIKMFFIILVRCYCLFHFRSLMSRK